MSITPLTANLNNIQALADQPNATSGLTPTQVKTAFDAAGNSIKMYINNTLIPEINTEIAAMLSAIPDLNRQGLINDNFDVWEDGVSFTVSGYGPDGWYYDLSNATGSRQSAGALVGSQYYSRITMTASGYGSHYQALESDIVKKFNGKTVILPVRLRRNASFASDILIIIQKNATPDTLNGGTWTNIAATVVPSSSLSALTTSDDWYTASVSASIPNDGSANGLRIAIQQVSAQNAGAYYEVSQVQMNAGSTLLPFQPKSYAEEFLLCQRHFQKGFSYRATGTFYSSTSAALVLPHNIPMRIAPTVTLIPGSVTVDDIGSGAKTAASPSLSVSATTTQASRFDISGFAGSPNTFRLAIMNSDSIRLDARL